MYRALLLRSEAVCRVTINKGVVVVCTSYFICIHGVARIFSHQDELPLLPHTFPFICLSAFLMSFSILCT